MSMENVIEVMEDMWGGVASKSGKGFFDDLATDLYKKSLDVKYYEKKKEGEDSPFNVKFIWDFEDVEPEPVEPEPAIAEVIAGWQKWAKDKDLPVVTAKQSEAPEKTDELRTECDEAKGEILAIF